MILRALFSLIILSTVSVFLNGCNYELHYPIPDLSKLNEKQQTTRRHLMEEAGVVIADGDFLLSDYEIHRLRIMIDGFNSMGLINGILHEIAVTPGPPENTHGSRPRAFAAQQYILFYGNTSPGTYPGTVYGYLQAWEFYFPHELGHILSKNHPKSAALLQRFTELHNASTDRNDFVSDYAMNTLEEDWAETFSLVSHPPYNSFYIHQLVLNSAFDESSIRTKKILTLMEFLAESTTARLLMFYKPDGIIADGLPSEQADQDQLTLGTIEYDIRRNAAGEIVGITLPEKYFNYNGLATTLELNETAL